MIIPRFHCRAEGRKLVFDRPEVFGAYVQGLVEKGDLELSVQPWRKEKSLQQLRYVHGVIFALCSEASGYTRQEVKGLLKGEFLTEYIEAPDGKKIAYVKSLADLTMPEMKEFIDDCIILAAKHWSCVIPDAEEVKV
jgi:hypothetical protein